MAGPRTDELTIREQLQAKRNVLYTQFLSNPLNTPLAIEIKLIDDWIARLTSHLDLGSPGAGAHRARITHGVSATQKGCGP
jgi:hypothetical protein